MSIKTFLFSLIVFSLLLGAACQKTPTVPPPEASANAKRFPFKGTVVSVDKAKKEATISHDEIPGYMAGMTMPFPIKDDWVMDELAPGAEIRAELVVDKGDYYLEKIGIMANAKPGQAAPPTEPESAVEGKDLPDLPLTNQDGKKISLKDFKGKAVAITFIYTRCPIPTFCPRMSLNFSEMAMNIIKRPELKDKMRLLSISFDPKYDTPAILKKYGAGYYNKDVTPDFNVWELGVGTEAETNKIAEFFGLVYKADDTNKEQIIHSLRTAIVGPDGKVVKVFRGGEWTSGQALDEMEKTLTK